MQEKKIYSLTHVAVLSSANLFCVRKISGPTGGPSTTESVRPFVCYLSSLDGLYAFSQTYVSQVTRIGRVRLNNLGIIKSISQSIHALTFSFFPLNLNNQQNSFMETKSGNSIHIIDISLNYFHCHRK